MERTATLDITMVPPQEANPNESPPKTSVCNEQQIHEAVIALEPLSLPIPIKLIGSSDEKANTPTASTTKLARELVLTSIPSMLLCVAVAGTDASKMVVSFAMKHYNAERYPLDACLIVFLTEAIKAIFVLVFHLAQGGGNPMTKFDPRILVPCALYAITNNVFFIALLFVTPAVWMVLIQIRLAFLLFIYRVMFKHSIVVAQWVGALVLVLSVALVQIDQVQNFMDALGPALILAAISSLLSAVAGVYIEIVLKSGGEDELWRRQFHLYVGASLVSLAPFLVSKYYFSKQTFDVTGDPVQLIVLICLSIFLSAVHGITTSLIIKKLDNIIRYQLGALIYIFTAILNKALFPDKFNLSGWYVLSVILVLYSMFIMERKAFI